MAAFAASRVPMNQSERTTPTWILLGAIATVASIEFIQNGMLNFASSYVMGGVGAGPEEYSLAAMAYASAAILSLFMHTWMVERVGYRNLVLLSLLAFAGGGLICGGSGSASSFILGRAVQGAGGATFLTAGRLLVNMREGAAKQTSLVLFSYALLAGSTLGPLLGAWLLRNTDWRWLFWGMLPLLILPALVALFAFPGKTVEPEDETRFHPMAIGLLIIFVFLVQSLIQRVPFAFFGRTEQLHLALWAALAAGLLFIATHRWTPTDQHRWRSLSTWTYLTGLVQYFICYFVLASNSFILPVLVQQGLGFDVPTSAGLLTVTFLASMGFCPLFIWVYFKLCSRFSKQITQVIAALALAAFGFCMHGVAPASTLGQLGRILILNGCFLVFFISPVAISTFSQVDSDHFGHAYQSKNIARQLALSLAVAFSTIFLQWRNALHFNRLGERISQFNAAYQQTFAQLRAMMPAQDPRLINQLLTLRMQRQTVLMSCLEYYQLLQWLGLAMAAVITLRLATRHLSR